MENKTLQEIITEYNTGGLISPLISAFSRGPGFSKPVEIVVENTIKRAFVNQNPAAAENTIRWELARELANKLIEEDLVVVQTNDDIEKEDITIRAKIKILQE